MSVTIIVPTTGSDTLFDAVASVLDQNYFTDCLVVIDGPQFEEKVYKNLQSLDDIPSLYIITLHENTGAGGNYGQRIYAAMGHLINSSYIGYLDEDNWLDENHVSSLIDLIERDGLDWAHSRRKIYSKTGEYICNDECESLGKETGFVDTNCYLVRKEVAKAVGHVWHSGWGGDRVFYSAASQVFPKFDSTGLYTTNYRLGGNEGSVKAEFFLEGNKRRA